MRGDLSVILARTSRTDESFDEFRKAEELAPEAPWIPHNRGAVLLQNGRPERARAEFEEAVRRDPTFQPAWYAFASPDLSRRSNERWNSSRRDRIGRRRGIG